jgi:hypothetical protein
MRGYKEEKKYHNNCKKENKILRTNILVSFNKIIIKYVRFEVNTIVNIKMAVLWYDVHSVGIYHLLK